MRYFLLGIVVLLGFQSFASPAKETDKKFLIDIVITSDECEIDTLLLFAWQGIQVKPVAKAGFAEGKKGKGFQFKLDNVAPGMYYIGQTLKDLKPVLIDNEKKLSLTGSCVKISNLKIEKSPLNEGYDKTIARIKTNNDNFFFLIQDYQKNINDPEKKAEIEKKMAKIDKNKKSFLDSIKKANPFLARIVALNSYMSYQNSGKKDMKEGDYLATTFFQFVDLKDANYANLPYFFESVKSYSTNLGKVGLSLQQQEKYFDALLAKVPPANANFQPTLLGVSFGLMAGKTQLFTKYAKLYIQHFKGKEPTLDQFLEQQIATLRGPLPVGDPAPNIKAKTPEDKDLELKDLRGKVVLIDFWASWCGPCRKENPNVVKVYKKYKDKGFEILGVSLDKDKKRWVDAIAKDQLTWPHVSDLKGWASAPAKLYGVKGIPFTVLVDKEGNILATRLRGHSLEAKLKEIFGE